MSKYTTQLRWIVEQMGQGLPIPDGQRYADAVYKYIGLNEYPIFNDDYRSLLNDKIIDHFYFREIGFETAAQFSWEMRRTMNEIMPYYNELYKTRSLIDDPLTDFQRTFTEEWDADRHDTGTTTNTATRNGNETEVTQNASTDHNRNVYQDTPMSLLDNDGSPSVEGLDYATNVTYDDGSSSVNGQRTLNRGEHDTSEREDDLNRNEAGTKTHDERGRNHSQAYLLKEFRETFINIDLEVINDLETLFMGLW